MEKLGAMCIPRLKFKLVPVITLFPLYIFETDLYILCGVEVTKLDFSQAVDQHYI